MDGPGCISWETNLHSGHVASVSAVSRDGDVDGMGFALAGVAGFGDRFEEVIELGDAAGFNVFAIAVLMVAPIGAEAPIELAHHDVIGHLSDSGFGEVDVGNVRGIHFDVGWEGIATGDEEIADSGEAFNALFKNFGTSFGNAVDPVDTEVCACFSPPRPRLQRSRPRRDFRLRPPPLRR